MVNVDIIRATKPLYIVQLHRPLDEIARLRLQVENQVKLLRGRIQAAPLYRTIITKRGCNICVKIVTFLPIKCLDKMNVHNTIQ